MSEIGIIGNIARFILSVFVMLFMVDEAILVNDYCDINIAVSGIILIWIGTFRIWR